MNRDCSIKGSEFIGRFWRSARSKFKSMLANYIIYTTVYQTKCIRTISYSIMIYLIPSSLKRKEHPIAARRLGQPPPQSHHFPWLVSHPCLWHQEESTLWARKICVQQGRCCKVSIWNLVYFERENMKWDDWMDGPIHPEITEDNHLEERFCWIVVCIDSASGKSLTWQIISCLADCVKHIRIN